MAEQQFFVIKTFDDIILYSMDVGTQTVGGFGDSAAPGYSGVKDRGKDPGKGVRYREGGWEDRGRGRYQPNSSRRYSLSAAERPHQYQRRRSSERYSQNPYIPFKRRYQREKAVLPTKFLLGGSITDPLNLNSLADEEVSRLLNAPTPVPSPSTIVPSQKPADPPLEIIRPVNVHDPLNLASGDEGVPIIAQSSTSRKRHRSRKRKNKKKNTEAAAVRRSSDTVSTDKNQTDFQNNQYKSSLVQYRRSSVGAAFARRPAADPIVSPVVPQVSPRRKRPRTSSCGSEELASKKLAGQKGQMGAGGVGGVKMMEGGEESGAASVGETSNNKIDKTVCDVRMSNKNKKRQRQTSTASETSNQPKKYRPADEKFVHGNYVAYYGYRNPASGGALAQDPRLSVLPEGLLEGKDVLDIGCNVGHVTLCIARDFSPRRIVGVDIDPKLIGIAKKNIRHYMDDRSSANATSALDSRRSKGSTSASGSSGTIDASICTERLDSVGGSLGAESSLSAGRLLGSEAVVKSSILKKERLEKPSGESNKRTVSFAEDRGSKILHTDTSDSCNESMKSDIQDNRTSSSETLSAKSNDKTALTEVVREGEIVSDAQCMEGKDAGNDDKLLDKTSSDESLRKNENEPREDLDMTAAVGSAGGVCSNVTRNDEAMLNASSTASSNPNEVVESSAMPTSQPRLSNKMEEVQLPNKKEQVQDASHLNAAVSPGADVQTHKEVVQQVEVVQRYPVSMEMLYGPLTAHQMSEKSPQHEMNKEQESRVIQKSLSTFPRNVMFQASNYVADREEVVTRQRPEYDVIICFSVTKWMHLNSGDEGLKRTFRRMYAHLRPGGRLVLEAQNWLSYKKKKKMSDSIFQTYQSIRFKPEEFVDYLLSSEVGFSSCRLIGVPYNKSKGFQRPIHIFTKDRQL